MENRSPLPPRRRSRGRSLQSFSDLRSLPPLSLAVIAVIGLLFLGLIGRWAWRGLSGGGGAQATPTLVPGDATLEAFYQAVAATRTATNAPPTPTPTATPLPPVCVAIVRDGDILSSILSDFDIDFDAARTYYKYRECKKVENQVACFDRQEVGKDYRLDVGEWVEIPDLAISPEKCQDSGGRMTR